MRSVSESAAPVPKQWRTALALALWSSLMVVALVVWLRKLSGAFTHLGDLWGTVAVVLAALTLSVVGCLCFLTDWHERLQIPSRIAIAGITLTPPLALGFSLSPLPAMTAFWFCTVLLLSGGAWFALIRSGDSRCLEQSVVEPDPQVAPRGIHVEETPVFRLDPGHRLSQWMARTLTADRREQITGAVHVQFLPEQKQTAIHLSFSPPFTGRPEVTCESLGEPPIRLKVTAVYPYGARIDAKRTGETGTADNVEVRFSAISPADANRQTV
jgi:hypothetical protein